MPNWTDVLHELRTTPSPFDTVRRKYLKKINGHTNRNVIAYYSGWLQKQPLAAQGVTFALDEVDKSGFMTAIYGLDRSLGLDLILHTPGGSITALEGLVTYLRSMFGRDVRAIVPQIAMSAGTMLALTCKEIILGKHSSLGPIDPQLGGMPAHGVIEEVRRAQTEIATTPVLAHFWMPILGKYPPTLIGGAEKAIKLAETLVTQWLETGMYATEPDATAKAQVVVNWLGQLSNTLAHDRRVSIDEARSHGIKVIRLEDDAVLQDLVLSAHHAYITTLSETQATRIIENHDGIAHIQNVQMVATRVG